HPVLLPCGFAGEQWLASFQTGFPREPRPAFCAPGRPPTRAANTNARQSADSPDSCSPKGSLLPGNSPACPPAHNIAALLRPNASLSSENRCHPRSTPALALSAAWPLTRNLALRPAPPHHSRARQPLRGATIDASAARCLAPHGPPSAPRFFVLPAAAIPHNTALMALPDRRAPQLAPGHPYMPRSASPVGLAWSLCPQNNSIRICSLCNTVVLVQMMSERGIRLVHTTILRWVQRYVPEFEKCWSKY